MGQCGRNSVILDGLTVEVFTDFEDVSFLSHQCLIEDNPDRITINVMGDPSSSVADIVVVVRGNKEFVFGWLARAIKTLDDAKGQKQVVYENAVVYWR